MLSGVLWPSMVKGSVYYFIFLSFVFWFPLSPKCFANFFFLKKLNLKKKKKKKKKKRKEPMELRSAHQRGSGDLALGLLVFPTGM